MTAASIERALTACAGWLAEQDAPEASIAAHEAGTAASGAAARRWIGRIIHQQDSAGGWDGDLLRTAESLLTIQELRTAAALTEQDPGIGRAHEWLRSRRGVAGSWADGCTPERHRLGLCHHSIGGFFSPAPPEVPCPETRLRCGARLLSDGEVRIVTSTTALRCMMVWGLTGRDNQLHLSALRRLVRAWGDGPVLPDLSTGALLAAIHALIGSSSDDDRTTAEWGLRLVGGKQRGDGSWVETDAFQALEVIGAAVDAGIAPDRTRRALWHGARLLISTQQADGSWGAEYGARRALIAWRTFRRVDPDGAA